VDPHRIGNSDPAARPPSTARRRLAIGTIVVASMIAGVLGWRWALVEATTEYSPEPDSAASDAEARPHAKRSPPPIELEVTVLDVHTAKAAKAPFATRASTRNAAAEARVPAPAASAAKTRR
jgi:hypothetical protein